MRASGRWGAAGGVALLALGGMAAYALERPRTTVVRFEELPVRAGPDGLSYSPIAPTGFPDCTIGMLDANVEDRESNVGVTFRPKAGLQCGFPVYPDSWWVDAGGKRFEWRGCRGPFRERLLLMGRAGIQDSGGIESGCGMKPPITYFVDLGGEPFEVGAIEKPECYGGRQRLSAGYVVYRGGGLETPAGSLDAALETPQRIEGDEISFTLVMTNDTSEDIVISRCMFVDIDFVASGAQPDVRERGYRTWLNCPAAPDVVEPGDKLRFALVAPLENATGPGTIEVEVRDENRLVQKVVGDPIEIAE